MFVLICQPACFFKNKTYHKHNLTNKTVLFCIGIAAVPGNANTNSKILF